jgi:hypothetical protein
MGAGAIGAGIGGLGDIIGMLTGSAQQSQTNQAISQLSSGLSSILGVDEGAVNQLLGNYFGQTQPALNQLTSTLAPQQQQYAAGASGAATNLQNNPYLSQISGISGQLQNYNALSPAQIAQLQTQAGNAAQSAASTMLSQSGGYANPNAVAQSLTNQAGQTAAQTATGLGSQVASQQLQALLGAGGLTSTAGSQYLSGQEGAGGLLSGLSSNALSGLLSGLGLQSGALGEGMSALQGIGGTYQGLLNTYLGAAQNQGNPFATGLSSLGSIIGSGAFNSPSVGSGYTLPGGGSSLGPIGLTSGLGGIG